jgi:hypothetical protein
MSHLSLFAKRASPRREREKERKNWFFFVFAQYPFSARNFLHSSMSLAHWLSSLAMVYVLLA